ncbi:MAG: DUF1489 domain-containing protein [Pseudomonadota bacterium]|jgi:hypothetical protein|nr:DUF1489 domain-containing protein [Pseudomonadota bacterium]
MPALNISKVAVGCATLEALKRRQEGRLSAGIVPIQTRFRPKRADELVGGSIYWIIKHRITARQTILGFAESQERKTIIQLHPELVPVRAWPKRAHQGWRYLSPDDAPADFSESDDGLSELPPALFGALSALALV